MQQKKEFQQKTKFNRTYSRILGLVLALATIITTLVAIPLVGAGGNNNNIGTNVIVPNSCSITDSNTLMNFGTISPGTNTAGTVNVLTVTNTGANPTNILVSGTNPTYISNSFYIENTIYSATANSVFSPGTTPTIGSSTSNVETRMSGSPVDTLIFIPGGGATTNNIWFGQAVPAAQVGGTYAWSITVGSTC